MGGCCVGLKFKMNNDDVLIIPEELKKKEEFINLEKSFIVFNQNIKKIKEKTNQKSNENDKKENKIININIKVNSPIKEININYNKKRIIKNGSERVQNAVNYLKLISIEEVINDKKLFFFKN